MNSGKESKKALWSKVTKSLALIMTLVLVVCSVKYSPVKAGEEDNASNYRFDITFNSGIGVFQNGLHSITNTFIASGFDGDNVVLNYGAEGFPTEINGPQGYLFRNRYTTDITGEEIRSGEPLARAKGDFALQDDGTYRISCELTPVYGEPSTVKVYFDAGEHGSISGSSPAEVSVTNYLDKNADYEGLYWYSLKTPQVEAESGYAFAGWSRDDSSLADLRYYGHRSSTLYNPIINNQLIGGNDYLYFDLGYSDAMQYNGTNTYVVVMKAQYEDPKILTLNINAGEHGHFENSTEQNITLSAPGVLRVDFLQKYYDFSFDFPKVVPDENYLFWQFDSNTSGFNDIANNQNVVSILTDKYSTLSNVSVTALYLEKTPATVNFDANTYGTVDLSSVSVKPYDIWRDGYGSDYCCYEVDLPTITVTDANKTFIGWSKAESEYANWYDVCISEDEYYTGDLIPIETEKVIIKLNVYDIADVDNFYFVAVYRNNNFLDSYKLKLTFNQPADGYFGDWIAKEKEITVTSSNVTYENGHDIVVFDNIIWPLADFNSVPNDYNGYIAEWWKVDLEAGETTPFTNLNYYNTQTYSMYESTPSELKVIVDRFNSNGELTVNFIADTEESSTPDINFYCPTGSGGHMTVNGSDTTSTSYTAYAFENINNYSDLVKITFPEVTREFGYNNLKWKADNTQGTGDIERVGFYYDLNGNLITDVDNTTFEPGESVIIAQEGSWFSKAYFTLTGDKIPVIGITLTTSAVASGTTEKLESLEPEGDYYYFTYTLPKITVEDGKLSAAWTLKDKYSLLEIDGNGTVSIGGDVDGNTQITIKINKNDAGSIPADSIEFEILQDADTVRDSGTFSLTTNHSKTGGGEGYVLKPGTWNIGGDGIEYNVASAFEFTVDSDGTYSFSKK